MKTREEVQRELDEEFPGMNVRCNQGLDECPSHRHLACITVKLPDRDVPALFAIGTPDKWELIGIRARANLVERLERALIGGVEP
jgi:hypothetical protein